MAKFNMAKFNKPKNKKLKIVAIILAIVIAIGVAVSVFLIVKEKDDNTMTGIYIATKAEKTEFVIGAEPDYTGLKVYLTFKNADSRLLDLSECQITGFDSSKVERDQVITIAYQEFTCQYTITVKKDIGLFNPVPVSITFKTLPDKLEYKVNDWLNRNGGMLICEYNDGLTREIPLLDKNMRVKGFDSSAPTDEQILTVEYKEMGVTVSTTYTIKVTE